MRTRISNLVFMLLVGISILNSAQSADYVDPTPGKLDPSKIPLYVAENVFDAYEGSRILCGQVEPASLPLVEKGIADFQNRYSELVGLAKRSRYLKAAKERAFAAHKKLLEMYPTAEEKRQLADLVCNSQAASVLGNTPKEQQETAKQWAKILRDAE